MQQTSASGNELSMLWASNGTQRGTGASVGVAKTQACNTPRSSVASTCHWSSWRNICSQFDQGQSACDEVKFTIGADHEAEKWPSVDVQTAAASSLVGSVNSARSGGARAEFTAAEPREGRAPRGPPADRPHQDRDRPTRPLRVAQGRRRRRGVGPRAS